MHHFGGLAATALLFALLLSLALPTPLHAQATPGAVAAAGSNGLVQRGVPAEASAENAVVAQERAMASARRTAYQRMAGAFNLPRDASDEQIESLVDSVVIESERSTRSGFTGRVTVNFNPGRVQDLAAGRSGAPGGGGVAEPSPAVAPPVASVDAAARFGSLREWLEIRRRLLASPAVANVEVLALATDAARLRIMLRSPAREAAGELARGGVLLQPAGPSAWQVGLARGA